MTRAVCRLVGLLGLLAASPCVADGWTSDLWITAKAKIALLTSDGLTASDVSVDTLDGRVSLFGIVPSEGDKQRAEDITRGIAGVRDVRNLLRIVSPGHESATPPSEASLRAEVEKALRTDPRVEGTSISVVSVTDGVVVLEGVARNSAEHLSAIDRARRVPGVRRVRSSVQTPAEDAALDVWTHHEFRQGGRGVFDAASDLWLAAETRLRLLADARVPALDVGVDCSDEVITLFGIVPSEQAKRTAAEDARRVSGVRGVRNELQVVPAAKRSSVQARDEQIEQAVYEAIYRRPEMRHAAVRVMVRNGVVRLSGTVPSQQHRLFAATAARRVAGVRAVHVDTRVTTVTEQPQATAAHSKP
ncbi:MAG TPA: BON domain-containing protein [Candidatus Binatia bacterium]|nr:BON domain-containing protein [Candidatus Binatia bacterium]